MAYLFLIEWKRKQLGEVNNTSENDAIKVSGYFPRWQESPDELV